VCRYGGLMRFIFFGGGDAGRVAALALMQAFPEEFAGIVWDEAGGPRPEIEAPNWYREDDGFEGSSAALLCSGYGKILRSDVLARFSLGAFNAHPSLLPAFRGRHAIHWAISSGETIFGVTVHRMTAEIDCGEYVMMRCCRIGLSVDSPEIVMTLARMAAGMLVELMEKLIRSQALEPLPVDFRAERYFRRRTPHDGQIDWKKSSYEVISRVRAGALNYPAFAIAPDGSTIGFTGKLIGNIPGEVLLTTLEGCLIATGDGVVWLVPDRPVRTGDVLR
jgi:methionyl-tRNA formyltransferase